MKILVNLIESWRIKRVLKNVKGKLLDVGCGNNRLVKKYGNGIGVDVYPWDGIDLLINDSSSLPFNDNEFDTITIVAALNHIPNRITCLKEVNRVLSNDGKIVITMITPRISKIWHRIIYRWDSDQHERGMTEGEVWGFTVEQIHKLLELSGFQVIKHEHFMFYLNHIYIGKKR